MTEKKVHQYRQVLCLMFDRRWMYEHWEVLKSNGNYSSMHVHCLLLFSGCTCLNLTGGLSPCAGNTRAPTASLPVRVDTGGGGDDDDKATDSVELLLSFCSVVLFANTKDEYKLVDIEDLFCDDSFVRSE